MALRPQSFEQALLTHRPLKRSEIARKTPLRTKTPLKAKAKPKRAKRKRLPTVKTLKKRVWFHFSIFVRTRDADAEGYVQCSTCPARHKWNSGEIHAGHWIHNRLDFDERNVHPQCVKCNYHWNTQVNVSYSIFMVKTYGVEVMEELRLLSNTRGNKYTRIELDELLAKYKALNAQNPLLRVE